ncbi:unnamed protein product [Didymodactylos carnosus]|uniref:Uncharacterized protein n=1 Tax=Didymodactylos carnosus TaxID=1234261 RepID=A0A815HIK4_9BILA|nr:unnamed protein product [Didymodactylos carnosus]CAF4222715.1 unnamed protein product [Didymodactylos carnosus]
MSSVKLSLIVGLIFAIWGYSLCAPYLDDYDDQTLFGNIIYSRQEMDRELNDIVKKEVLCVNESECHYIGPTWHCLHNRYGTLSCVAVGV